MRFGVGVRYPTYWRSRASRIIVGDMYVSFPEKGLLQGWTVAFCLVTGDMRMSTVKRSQVSFSRAKRGLQHALLMGPLPSNESQLILQPP